MADWDVIAKQRLTEDWATLRAAYLPLNQAMRRTVEFLDKGGGTFDELLAVARERVEGMQHNLTALANRRSPWVRLEAIRNLRVLASGLRGAASDDPRALLRYLFAISELLGNVWRDAPTNARVSDNMVVEGELDFWFGCECCAVGKLRKTAPRSGQQVLFAWTLDEFEDYLASERYALPSTPRVAASEDLGLPVVDIPSEALRKGNDWFGSQGGGLYVPLDLKHIELI